MKDNRFSKQTAAELIEQIDGFKGDPGELLHNILAIQCVLGDADGGVIVTINQEQNVDVLAIYPRIAKGSSAPGWLAQAVGFVPEAFSSAGVFVKSLDGTDAGDDEDSKNYVLIFPLTLSGGMVLNCLFRYWICWNLSLLEKGKSRLCSNCTELWKLFLL